MTQPSIGKEPPAPLLTLEEINGMISQRVLPIFFSYELYQLMLHQLKDLMVEHETHETREKYWDNLRSRMRESGAGIGDAKHLINNLIEQRDQALSAFFRFGQHWPSCKSHTGGEIWDSLCDCEFTEEKEKMEEQNL